MVRCISLSILILIATFSFYGQSISVTVGGNPVQKGSEVTSYDITEEVREFQGEKQIYYLLTPQVMITSSLTEEYTVSITNNTLEDVADGENNPIMMQFCWPFNCKIINRGSTSSSTGTLYGETPADILLDTTSFQYFDEPFSFNALIDIVSTEDPDVSFNFILNMRYDPAFITSVETPEVSDSPKEFYTLSGIKTEHPGKGIFLMKKGNQISKICF